MDYLLCHILNKKDIGKDWNGFRVSSTFGIQTDGVRLPYVQCLDIESNLATMTSRLDFWSPQEVIVPVDRIKSAIV